MRRPMILSENKFGFHAFGKIVSPSAVIKIIDSWQGAKGFNHPSSDVQGRIIPTPIPLIPIGFCDYQYSLTNGDFQDVYSKRRRNATKNLLPWKPFAESWPWEHIRKILHTDAKFHYYNFRVSLTKNVKAKISGKKISYFICLHLDPSNENLWDVRVSTSPVTSWNEGVTPQDDQELVDKFSCITVHWAKLTGMSHLLKIEKPDKEGLPVWRVIPATSKQSKSSFLELDIWCPQYDQPLPNFIIPNEYSSLIPIQTNIGLRNIELQTAIQACDVVFDYFFGKSHYEIEVRFNALDDELTDFKNHLEPLFGPLWLQWIGGFGRPDYAVQVDEDVPDWSIQPVAYFKVLGSWRTIDLLKEPEGWRFVVTGNYTKDWLNHRHIRGELARKAGMTSETLWEPQAVGEGWYGVPG